MTDTAPRRLLIPALSTLAMLAVLLFLGTWQVQRLAWKTALLAALDTAEKSPAVPLSAHPPAFARVRAEGMFLPAHVAWYGIEVRSIGAATIGGTRWLEVLFRPGAAPVLVDRGWVPDVIARNPPPVIAGYAAVIEGYVRPPAPAGLFTPAPDLLRRHFYALDPAVIGPTLGVPDLAPFVLVAMGPTPPDRYPDPARTLPRPANNHLVYAVTWYSLAAVLLVIFALYVRKASRP